MKILLFYLPRATRFGVSLLSPKKKQKLVIFYETIEVKKEKGNNIRVMNFDSFFLCKEPEL